MKDEKHNIERLVTELQQVRGDFAAFNELVFGKNPYGLPPIHPGQEQYFYDTLLPKYNVLTCGNSWGKTDLIARLHVYYCFYKEGLNLPPREAAYAEYNTLNCAYTYEVSEKEFNRILKLRQKSPILRFMVDKVDNIHRKITFKNGSCFVTGSTDRDGKLLEGERYSLLTVEEAGWEKKLRFMLDNVLRPRTIVPYMLDGGKLHFIGTPKPFSDSFYYTLYKRGEDEKQPRYYSKRGSVYENIFLSEDEVRKIEADYENSPYKAQVIYGEFVSDLEAPFKHEMVFGMFHETLEKKEKPHSKGKYLVAWDLARKSDKTVGTVLNFGHLPLILRENTFTVYKQRWTDVYDAIKEAHRIYRPVGAIVDSTGLGDVVMERIEEIGIPVEGIVMTPKTKEGMILTLQDAFSKIIKVSYPYDDMFGQNIIQGCVKSYEDPILEDQLIAYRWDDTKLETDTLISLALGVYYLYNIGFLEHSNTDYMAKTNKGKSARRRGRR